MNFTPWYPWQSPSFNRIFGEKLGYLSMDLLAYNGALAWVYHCSWQDWKPPHHNPFPLLICFSDASPFPGLILLTTSGSLIFSGFQRGYQNQPFLRSSFLKGVTHFKTERILKTGYFLELLYQQFSKSIGRLICDVHTGIRCCKPLLAASMKSPHFPQLPCGSQGYTHRKNKCFKLESIGYPPKLKQLLSWMDFLVSIATHLAPRQPEKMFSPIFRDVVLTAKNHLGET